MQASSERPLSSQGPAPTSTPASCLLHPPPLLGAENRPHSLPPPPPGTPAAPGGQGLFCVGWEVGGGLSPTGRASREGPMSPRAAVPPPASARPHQAYQAQVEAGSTSPLVAGSRVGCVWRPAAPAHPGSAPHSSQHPTSLQPLPWAGHPWSVASGSRLEIQDGVSITPHNPAPVNKQLSAPTPPGQEAFLTAHLPNQFRPPAGAATCHGCLPAGPWDLTQAGQHPSSPQAP